MKKDTLYIVVRDGHIVHVGADEETAVKMAAREIHLQLGDEAHVYAIDAHQFHTAKKEATKK